jgi:hypothetical protein
MDYKKLTRAVIANRKNNLSQKIDFIKQNINSGDFNSALKLHPPFLNQLKKKPYFKNIEDISIREPYSFSKDLRIEIRWLLVTLQYFFSEIDEFLKLKKDFETSFIKEKHTDSKEILKKIESKFGITFWSLESKFLIEDRVNGNNANWSLLSDNLEKIKTPIHEFIINSSSKRIESNMSFESYLNQFQNDIDSINANGMIEDFLVFKNFNYPNYEYSYKNLESVIYVASTMSIIDQYLLLVEIISYNVINSTDNDKLYFSFINSAKKSISNDPVIINLYNIINEKGLFDDSNFNHSLNNCLNSYYSGDFTKSLEISRDGILENPLEFEYYEVYCKSLINLKEKFTPVGLSDFSDKILLNVFGLFSFNGNEKKHFTFLINSSLHLMNMNFGRQIFGLLSEIEGFNEQQCLRGVLSSKSFSYKLLYFHQKRKAKILKNLDTLKDNHSFKISKFKLGLDSKFEESLSKSTNQASIFNAINLFNKREYKKVIDLLEQSKNLNDIHYYYERKIGLLFYSYIQENQIKKALQLFGEVFFNEQLKTRKIKTIELFDKISLLDSNIEIEDLIELPILVSIHAKDYDLYETYDNFLYSNEIDDLKTLDISKFMEKFGVDKSIYFFENIVKIDTIKYSSEYSSISEVEDDIVMILNQLILINPNKKNNYEKEINEIYRINSVRKVLKEVDEGRLYIDVDSLKEKQIRKFNEDFKRFKEIEQSSSVQSLISFNASNTHNWNDIFHSKTSSYVSYNSADYLAFKSIYLESRDNFLFSKEHGLDSSLSTRIRHGALKNHIRSVFEKLDLITSKLNSEYKENIIWKNKLKTKRKLNTDIQQILKTFSKSIDDYLIYIVEQLVQIQTENKTDKSDGIFQFFTNDLTLFEFYKFNKKNFDSIDTIIEMLLTNLVNHTILELQGEINEKFETEIWNNFKKIIDDSISSLRKLNLPNDYELIPNLIKSGTEMQNELEVIADWFYLNTSNSSTLLNIRTVIDASIELTNKIHPNFRIAPVIKTNCEPFGVYSSLIFVFNILFNNVISYSGLNQYDTNIEIEIEIIDSKYSLIRISNNYNKNKDYSENIERLTKVKNNWNDHTNIERSNKEGESGFDKIKRMLIYETYSKTDKFDFTIENGKTSISLFFPHIKTK